MKKLMPIVMALFVMAACGKTSAGNTEELLISSASSLMGVMHAAQAEYTKIHPDQELTFNFSSSGKLSNQIQQGAPVDLFLSASEKDMQVLIEKELVDPKTVQFFAGNKLVLASAEELEDTDSKQLLTESGKTIAVGEPDSVPVGYYTKQSLQESGVWEGAVDNFVFAKDARQVLSYVESGNADLGIVYSSDAIHSEKILTTLELPEARNPIIYPGGIIRNTGQRGSAEAFLAFLMSDEGQKLFAEYGFTSAEGAQP